jgi:transglutaminase-like putative cysteine protease
LADRLTIRPALAAAPAAAVVAVAWSLLEEPASRGDFAVAVALALVPALPRERAGRAAAAVVAITLGLALAFDTWPHRALDRAWSAVHDAPAVQSPFDPTAFGSLHGLVVVAAFGLALAASLGAAARRPAIVAVSVVVGVGFPAVLMEDASALRLGMAGLGAVLWAYVVLSVRDARRGLSALALAGLVALVSGGVAAAGLAPGEARVDWRGWDPFAGGSTDVSFLWDASYSGIDFPIRPTVVLRVRAPARAQYWRMSTLETFDGYRWIEHLYPVDHGPARRRLPPDPLVPRRDARPGRWLEQQVTVVGLDDQRLPAVSEPARVDGPSLGRVSFLSGGVMLAHRPARRGSTYTVWSFAPRPTPRALARSRPLYPASAERYLELWTASFPGFGAKGREAATDRILRDQRYRAIWPYRRLWVEARRLTGKARSPYEATLVLERWFRDRGGFRYEEHPPSSRTNPPLVDFVEVTRAGYCQHYAGAMTLMLRMLGIPARVAVGFTAGRWKAGVWTVTDQQAHAWVEAWFAGYGWLAFDPTPGRGTLSAVYTLASDSADAVRALGTGRFLDFTPTGPTSPGTGATPVATAAPGDRTIPSWLVVALCAPIAAVAFVLGAKRARRARRLGRDDPRRLAAGVRAELVSALVDRGASLAPDATPTDLRRATERVLGIPARSLAESLADARYGPPARTGASAARARTELRRVLSAAAERERPGRRLRAALSLRSLRPGVTPTAR